jgi:hypothetical protein
MKLYKMESACVPEYGGRRWQERTDFFLTDNLDKLKTYLKGEHGYELDENLTYTKYYRYDEASFEVRLEEVEVTIV